MIFVTVGNATQGFHRLLGAVDQLAGNGLLKDELVVVQAGNNRDFRASHCTQHDFIAPDEYAELIHQAEVVICHGGAGTLHHVFQVGKTPVVMPRRRKYGEHVDDQFELVKAIAAEDRVIPAYEPEDLPQAITRARQRNGPASSVLPSRAIALVAEAIEELGEAVKEVRISENKKQLAADQRGETRIRISDFENRLGAVLSAASDCGAPSCC